MILTEDKIKEINSKCPEDQGVFSEPSGIACSIKEPVIYMRWVTGGMCGGGYHESCHLHSFDGDGMPKFKVLDLVLSELKPDITYLQFKQVEELIKENDYDDNEDYYGNRTDYEINYIILSDLIKLLETF